MRHLPPSIENDVARYELDSKRFLPEISANLFFAYALIEFMEEQSADMHGQRQAKYSAPLATTWRCSFEVLQRRNIGVPAI